MPAVAASDTKVWEEFKLLSNSPFCLLPCVDRTLKKLCVLCVFVVLDR